METRWSTSKSSATTRDALLIGLLCVAAGAVLGKDLTIGGFRHGDSAAHALDGVLILDWAAAGPDAWRRPMAFALQQYAHYPTLGIGRHYPPGFAMVEAMFFVLLGVSVFSARLSVVFFGLMAVVGTYGFVRPLTNRITAVLAAILLVTTPAVTCWGRQTMLEIPTLAVLIWGAVVLSWYLRSPTWGRLGVLLGVSLLALLFKQTGLLLSLAIALTLLLGVIRHVVRPGHCLCSVIAASAAGIAVVLSLDAHGAALLRGDPTFPDPWSLEAMTFYPRGLWRHLGPVVLIASLVGVVVSWRKLGVHWTFLVLWVLVCYAMLTAADYKNHRFFLVGLFPFSVWAGIAAGWVLTRLPGPGIAAGAAIMASCAFCTAALATAVPHRPDYGPIVAANKDRIEGRVVLFGGLRDGDFVFAVRQHVPWRQATVARSSKLFYTCNGRTGLDFVSRVSSGDDVARLMQRFAFPFVFIERENKLGLFEEQLLRGYLAQSGAYRCVESHRLEADALPSWRDVTLEVYEATRPRLPEAGQWDVPIPRINRTARIDLKQWSREAPAGEGRR